MLRVRRLASYALDVFFLGAPWAPLVGLALDPHVGSSMAAFGDVIIVTAVALVATLVVFVLEVALFAARGRTLGMSAMGIVAVGGAGRRWAALVLDGLVVIVPFAIVAVLSSIALDGDTTKIVAPLAPLLAMAFNLAFALGPSARSLVDRMTGLRVARDLIPPASYGAGAAVVDLFLLLPIGAPMLLVFTSQDFLWPAIASGCALFVAVLVELFAWTLGRATIGARAVTRRI